ncbi:MAG: DUF4373 domain-containing protein [Flavobacteriaceae bacterium]|nr:DUF4373 domain-containing protein [Flavobacteriaceae bacterium]MBL4905795.1 DUF4373 domain-containing protein [Flavobacteriaceae bacterium]
MARPPRNNVDYFPFLCKEGKAMHFIKQEYKNDGYATWIKILRELAITNYHYLQLSDKRDFMYLSGICNVSIEKLNLIIEDLCELGEFDKELWLNNKVIWCQKFIDSIQDAYKKRNNECFTKQELLISLGITKQSKNTTKPIKSNIEGVSNTQSIVEYSIEDKNIVDNEKNIDNFKSKYLGNKELIDAVCKSQKINLKELESKLEKFNLHLIQIQKTKKSWDDYLTHFLNWLRKQPLESQKTATSNIPIG